MNIGGRQGSFWPGAGMKGRSLAFRLVLLSSLWIFAALLAGSFVITGLFRDYVRRNFDQRLETLLDGMVALSEIEQGQLVLSRAPGEPRFDVPYSGWYWQIADRNDVVQRSRSLWDRRMEPRRVGAAGGGEGAEILRYDDIGPQNQKLRVIERMILLPGGSTPYFYLVAGDTAESLADIQEFESVLGWALGALGSGLVAAVLLQVRLGLRPLRRIGEALGEIRSGRAEKLSGDFPLEVTPLADELNQLLDHNAEVVRRARTHVGNLAHALKTPVAVLANEADAAGDSHLAEVVRRQAALMKRLVDHHMARARAAASVNVLGARTELKPVIEALCRTLQRIYAERRISVDCETDERAAFRGERHDFEDLLGNLVDNACKWARRQVFVKTTASGGRIEITVDDDGPGLPEDQRSAVFQRGTRLDESTPGTGLGLSIVRDVAGLYGGSVTLDASPLGGLRAILTLPGFDPDAAVVPAGAAERRTAAARST
ncbi:MAG: sensor histidine kinase [Alphaproteobacteria bacterium]|nr:sensor histidine kinase [Alphaproteobacteria bacterium]